MDYFRYNNQRLEADGFDLTELAQQYGTPLYVYSGATIRRHIRVLQEAFDGVDMHLCYAIKANGNLGILQFLSQLGCDFDAVSVGELARARKAGIDAQRVIVSGVGKTDTEIAASLAQNVRYICIESQSELQAIANIAQEMGKVAPIAIRVNPNVDAQTHPYIATGLNRNKFGVAWDDTPTVARFAAENPNLELVGLTCHIGSQITQISPFTDAAKKMAELTIRLQTELQCQLRYIGMGGGLGIPYQNNQTPPPPAEYGKALHEILGPLGLTIILEPGRVIVGNAGMLLTRVTRIKQHQNRNFCIVDAGMNDLIRPALYQAHHDVVPLHSQNEAEPLSYDVVGPVCESADTFVKDYELPQMHEGELLGIRSAGAYAFVMACNYNGRRRPAEILVDEGQVHVVRERETYGELWRGENSLQGAPFDNISPIAIKE